MANNSTEMIAKIKLQIEGYQAEIQKFINFVNTSMKKTDVTKDLLSGVGEASSALSKLYSRAGKEFVSQKDVNQVKELNKEVQSTYSNFLKIANTARGDTSLFTASDTERIKELKQELINLKTEFTAMAQANGIDSWATKFTQAAGSSDALKKRIEEIRQSASAGDLERFNKAVADFETYATRYSGAGQWTQSFEALNEILTTLTPQTQQLGNTTEELRKKLENLQYDNIQNLSAQFQTLIDNSNGAKSALAAVGKSLLETGQNAYSTSSQINQLISRFASFTSIVGILNIVKRTIRSAFNDVKELDEAMNSIAVVTDYTTEELWQQVDAYAALAQEMGVTLTGAYEVQKLYYQQGRSTSEVTALTAETLKLARIAGLEYADATDAMTVALNAFKIEASDSASVVDVYSNLASHAAVSQSELATAMSKVASMASSVGMSLESSSAFLTQIIETTREAPETAGTALKTVLARFGEVKTLIGQGETTGTTDEGEEVDVNKIDTALKSVGVRLTDTTGQMRNLDDVILELAEKWDSLDTMTQRYIATQAAGSRQQSRFLALMGDSERLTELLGLAMNSAGASEEQFAKTQDSLASKLNNLKTAWTQFTTGITDSEIIKWAVDRLTDIINLTNTLAKAFDQLGIGGVARITALVTSLRLLNKSLFGLGPKIAALLDIRTLEIGGQEVTFKKKGSTDGSIYEKAFQSARDTIRRGWEAGKQTTEATNAVSLGTETGTLQEEAKQAAEKTTRSSYYEEEFSEILGQGTTEGTAKGNALGNAEIVAEEAIEDAHNTSNLVEVAAQGTEEGSIKGAATVEASEAVKDATENVVIANGMKRSVTEGAIEGSTKETASETSQTLLQKAYNKLRIVKAFKQGYSEGVSHGGGFMAGLASGIAAVISGAWLGVAVAAVVAATVTILKKNTAEAIAESKISKLQEEIDENTELLDKYQSEIDDLNEKETNGTILAYEKARLEYLEKQTEELKKQNKEKLKEQWTAGEKVRYTQDATVGGMTYTEGMLSDSDFLVDNFDSYKQLYQHYTSEMTKYRNNDELYNQYKEYLENAQEDIQTELDKNWIPYLDLSDTWSEEEWNSYLDLYEGLGDTLYGLSQAAPELYEELTNLAEAGALDGTTVENLVNKYPELQYYLNTTGLTANKLANELTRVAKAEKTAANENDWKATSTQLKTVKSTLSKIGDILSDFEENGFADVDSLAELYDDESFSGIIDELDDYVEAMNNTSSIEEAKTATNELVTAYLNQADVLNELKEGNEAVYIARLKQMGVENAEAIVAKKLSDARAEEYAETLDLIEVANNLSDETVDNTQYLQDLAEQCDSTADAVAYYALQKQIANITQFSTDSERQQLSVLIDALGEAGKAYQAYANIMAFVATQQSRLTEIQTKQKKSQQEADKLAQDYGYDNATAYIKALTANVDANIEAANDKLEKANADFQAKYLTPGVTYKKPTDTSDSDLTDFDSQFDSLRKYERAIEDVENEIELLEIKMSNLTDADAISKNQQAQVEAYEKKLSLIKAEQTEIQKLLSDTKAEGSDYLAQGWISYDANGQLEITNKYLQYVESHSEDITDETKETLETFEDWVEAYDELYDKSKDAEKSAEEIKETYNDLWNEWRDSYIDIVNELADIFEDEAQDEIDTLEDKYDEMKDADDDYLDSLRKNIEARRDARDRENDVEDIAKKQKRLQMLMRDTSGRNAGEIASLQEEIADAQQDLIDDDVDRMLDAMEDANDQEQENWDKEIETLEKQLEEDKKSGKFIQEAEALMKEGLPEVEAKFEDYYEKDGSFSNTEITKKLEELSEKFALAKNYTANDDYDTWSTGIEQSITNANQTSANGANGTTTSIVDTSGATAKTNIGISNWENIGKYNAYGYNNAHTSTVEALQQALNDYCGESLERDGSYGDATVAAVQRFQKAAGITVDGKFGPESRAAFMKKYNVYKSGGLVSYTGPAWVDGTSTNPEAFLSAEDTKNFTELKSILSSLMRADRITGFDNSTASAGNCTIYVNVDEIASDYDVDDAINRIKEEMLSGSQYRNINLVNRRR